jgi:hypothetical protein
MRSSPARPRGEWLSPPPLFLLAFLILCPSSFLPLLAASEGISPSQNSEWELVAEARPVAGNSHIVEYMWVVSRPPYGPYDKISLHRYVKADQSQQRPVFFYLPGTNMNGALAVTQEKYNLWLYLANKDIDVYTLDYRTHYVPKEGVEDFSFMAEWNYQSFLDDIAVAVAKSREVSQVEKVFLAGFSRGVSLAYFYASAHWQADLCGLVALDGGVKNPRGQNAFELAPALSAQAERKAFASDVSGRRGWDARQKLMRAALAGPETPALDPKFPTAAQQLESTLYNAWRPGGLANPVEGFSDVQVLAQLLVGYDRFYPAIQSLESRAVGDYEDHPTLTYDDHLKDINVPLLTFNSTGMGPRFLLNGIYSASLIASPDVTLNVLEGYGHLDVLVGERAQQEVFTPIYQWLQERAACSSP